MMRYIKKNPVVAFIILTFTISWGLWFPQIYFGKEIFISRVSGSFGPLLSALIISFLRGGKSDIKKLIMPFSIWQINTAWYIFCLFATALLVFTAIGIAFAMGTRELVFNELGKIYLVIPVFLYVLFFSVIGEETGWRGFALPLLQEKSGALMTSIYIGIIWGLWHLPLFYIEGNFHHQIPFGLFILQEIALSIVITWIYNNTKGSLLPVHIFHAASNTTLGVLPILPMQTNGDLKVLIITIGLLIILAICIVLSGTMINKTNKAGEMK